MEFETKAVHIGVDQKERFGATSIPIYETASYAYNTAEDLEEVFSGKKFGYIYSRIANPTVTAFEQKICSLENGIGSLAVASGMAAISTVIFALTEQGDEIISSKSLFGGTYQFFNEVLKKYGVNIIFLDLTDIETLKKNISLKTKLVFVETIGNPRLDVPDIENIANVTKEYNVPLIVDCTLTPPCIFEAKNFGANITVHSSTKYITGSGIAIGGVLTDLGNYDWGNSKSLRIKELHKKAGQFAFLYAARKQIVQNIGSCLSPFNAFLHNLGLETLYLRMEKHCSNAQMLSEFLLNEKKVKEVNYPGLEMNSFHTVAKKQFNEKFGGLLTFKLNSKEECFKFINNLKLTKNLANLGDAKTLIIHPASTIYHDCSKEEKLAAGVTDDLLRVSVGIENIKDIINDFKEAFEKL